MKENAPRIVRFYVFREILGSTLLCTLVLTSILLYGNLSKHDDDLFLALSISPFLFLELISLMLPFALSLGLPFGFSLAVIFCVGRWSADREVLGMQSLGIPYSVWIKPIVLLAIFVSLLGCLGSLHWVPIARQSFEQTIEKMLHQDLNKLANQGRSIEFPVSSKDNENFIGTSFSSSEKKITRASMNIGHVLNDEWRNIRVLLFSPDEELRGILHAKRGRLDTMESGFFDLNLFEVDYESVATPKSSGNSSTFVSFERWKKPLRLKLGSKNFNRSGKYLSVLQYITKIRHNNITRKESDIVQKQFNKYGSLAFSSTALAPLLIFFGLNRGRRETYANLFMGVFICLLYFLFCKVLGEMFKDNGFGWWLGNGITLLFGVIILKKIIKL